MIPLGYSTCVTKISEVLGVESYSLSNSTNHGGFGPPSLADRSERQIAITLHKLRAVVVSGYGKGVT